MTRKLSDDAEPSIDVDEVHDETVALADPGATTRAGSSSDPPRPRWRLTRSRAPWDLTFRISRDPSQR
jgi:hypothetical protein